MNTEHYFPLKGGDINHMKTMNPVERYVIGRAYADYITHGIIPLDTCAVLQSYGIDPEVLQDKFQAHWEPTTENTLVTIEATYEDVAEVLDAAFADDIEALIDIRDCLNKL
jgi:hypothetical protein